MKKRIETFKDELKHLNDYMNEVRRLEGEIETLEYEMENVKGIDYSKQSGSYNEQAAMNKILGMIERKEILEKRKKITKEKINYIGDILKKMSEEDRTLLIEVIADRRTYKQVCKERNISNTSTLYVMINSIIEEALKA